MLEKVPPPVLAEVGDREVNEGEPLTVQLVATDSDSSQNQLRYSALRSPVGSNLDPVSGLLSWTPNSFTGGLRFGIDVQVTDETGLTDVQTFRVSVSDVANGSAPVLTNVGDQSVNELQTISVQLVATDSDSRQDQLRYAALRSPVGSMLNAESGLFTWTPNSFAGGLRFGIDVQVTDDTGLTDTKTFRISVVENDGEGSAPVLQDIEKQTITEGQQLSVQLIATDSDSSQSDLHFAAVRSPVGSTLDPVSGVFRWTPNSFAGGLTFGVDVRVTDETGLSDTKTFRIEVQEKSNEILLLETQDFETVATRNLTIGDSIKEVTIDFQASFDRRDTDSINDAFEIALLDLDGNSLVHTVDTNRDAFFNRTEDEAPVGGVNTVVMGQKVKLDLSHIAVGTSASLIFRLVNNDDDTNTRVRITSIATSDNLLNTPASATLRSEAAGLDGQIDFARLSDVTGSFAIDYGRTSFNQADSAMYSKIELTNVGQVTIAGRMLAVFENPSSEQIALLRPDGRLPDGRFFVDVTPENEVLAAGDSTTTRDLALFNSVREQFDFDLTILAEVNHAPNGFTSVPPTVVEAGRTLVYTAIATDPDPGQALQYSIVRGNESISIDEATGELAWLTTTEQIGAHSITLRATDPFGLFVEQSFIVEVKESLQNRPPNFVTDPVTDATASSGFEITTVATGVGPTDVTVINGFRGPGLVTLNAGDQSLSQINSLGNDRFDLPTQVSVGEPAPTGQVLRSGYSIDVGLPALEHTGDDNRISGMDQADLNGDGTLDLVVSAYVNRELPSRTYQQFINVTLGNPDGTFGEATTVAELPAGNNSKFNTLRVADFDNDGHFDILTADRQTSTMYFLRGNGEGDFEDAAVTTLATNLYNFKSVDLDQDGNFDIVGMSSTQREFGYMLGLGDGSFDDFVTIYGDPAGPLIPLGAERNYAVSDMDGDGDVDVVLSEYRERQIRVLSNDGALDFSVAATLDAVYPFRPGATNVVFAVFAGDFNGDNHADFAYGSLRGLSGSAGGLGVYLGDGSGTDFVYQDGADAIVDYPNNAAGNGDPVDIDNDGDLDIVIASSRGGRSSDGQMPSVLINRGDGTFSTQNLTVPAFGESSYEFTNNEANAKGVLVGDYNQDGLPDISIYRTERSFPSVTVILADQPGVFASSSSLIYDPVVNSPQDFFEAGDFNNDGVVDLWSPRYQGISQTWLGRGDGSFEDPFPATPYIGNEFLGKGTVEDFNQDGILDVFWMGDGGVQNGPSARYIAALGNGDGTFEITFRERLIGSGGRRPDWSDLNGDGYLDFASNNLEGVQVYLYDVDNPGTWVFDNELLFSDLGAGGRGYGHAMSIDDFDQDGRSDIGVVSRLTDEPFRLVVYPGLGDGTFTSPVSTHFAEVVSNYTSPSWMTTGDFNEDGIPDVAVYEYYSISVHLGAGDGTFNRTDIYPAWRTATSETQLFVRDVNQDGHDDVLFTDWQGSQSLGILLGKGDGSFQDRIAYDVPTKGGVPAFGDFDNDGREDIVLPSGSSANYATILNGARQRLTDIVSVDLNGDGNDDVLATNTDNSRVKWFLGDNLGNLNRQPDLFTDFGPVALTVFDLDRNGSTEIITANRSARSISIFSGGVDNWTRTDISVGQAPIDVLSGLVDSDGAPDLLVIDEVNNALWVLLGNNDTTFGEPISVPLGDRPNDLLLADVDGDGNNDVVLSLPDSGRIMILPGDGLGGFSAPQYVTLTGSPSALAAVDFNQDGNLDLSATLSDLDKVAIIYGRGQNQFARPQLITVGDNPVAMSAEDADGDGRIDLIVSNQGDDTVSVIYNRFDPNEVYRYDADAIDPDGDPLTYAIVDGPGGLIINSETGALLWAASPDQVGENSVTISADDGRGGVATQTFKIDVQPARDNATPLFATEAQTTIGANEVFTYQATALDSDSDAIRYRLLDAPEGATIDPTTGLVTWDGRAEALKFNEFGQNGILEVTPNESYKTPSVTVEGWYKIDVLTASNRAARLFEHLTDTGHFAFRFQIAGNQELQLLTHFADSGTFRSRFDFIPDVDRWYHFAMTVDDATKLATLFVDGEPIGSFEMPSSLEYGTDRSLRIGGSQATVDNFRVWSVVRTQAEIQQGMAEQYDDNPLVTVDYRFNESGSYSVHDSSIYRNDGYFGLGVSTVVPRPASGLVNPGERSFTISVEDGRGGFDTQTFVLEVLPELRGSIVGDVFDDLNGDGIQNDGSDGSAAEAGLPDLLAFLDDNGNGFADPNEQQSITDADGNYRFDGLLPGDYPVTIDPVAGFEIPIVGESQVVANEESVVDVAAIQRALSQIQGQLKTDDGQTIGYWSVFADVNSDGVRNEDEFGAVTDRSGTFAIYGLDAGTYTVRAELPAGWFEVGDPPAVDLAANTISNGNDILVSPSNTSVVGGLHFVTTPPTSIVARDTLKYASVATAIADQKITYDVSLAPEGLTIDPATGLVAWRPTIDQIGDHLIVFRATDGSGSVSLQGFTVSVSAPNTAPVIASIALDVGFTSRVFAYDVVGQDAEGQVLSFSILNGPSSATIDSATGQLRWTPITSDIGSTLFEIEVRDESGGASTQQFRVTVGGDTIEATPFKIDAPRTRIGLGQTYVAQVKGVDQLDRPLVWSLTSGPSGMTISERGSISWEAGSGDLGVQNVQLLATNVDGETESYSFELNLEGRPVISAPEIVSTPVLSTVIGQTYSYDVLVDDADYDVLAFSLLSAPVGMSIDPSTGTVRWIADADQRGEVDVTIEVTDPDGASTTQAYKLRVSFAGGPPRIRSTPPTEANVGGTFLYSVIADDREGDSLTYRLLTAPAGATITETTGEISWTPTAGQVGQQAIVIEVSDGIGGASTQAFSIRVSDGVINLSPMIQSSAPRFTAVGSDYSYQISATDPESTTLSYSVSRGPAGLAVDNNGLVTWTPANGQSGQFVVTLVVTDEGGASAIESFELDVLSENRLPVVTSTAPVSTTKGASFRYDVLVSDPDLDPLEFELVNGPANASINAFGQIVWSSGESNFGNYDFEVRVSDPRGGETAHAFTVELVADTEAPKISVISNPGDGINSPWSGPFIVYVKAIDNVGIASMTLSANGQDIQLSADGTATFTFEEWTFRTITATGTAIDTSGNVSTQTITFDYDIPEGWSGVGGDEIPTAIISSPSDAESVTGMVSIVGTASHEDFDTYRLSYRHVNEAGFTEILQSQTEVVNGELGVWDTSLLRNDEYVIRLEVATSEGVPNVVEQTIGLAGELKLGNFQLQFTDMVIPVAGIPISITRVYDTLQADVEGEFGFGWRLEFRDTNLHVGLPKSGLEDIGIYSALRPGVKVYLNIPGEGRQGFTFNPDIRVLPGSGGTNLAVARPRFTPDPGVTSRLSTGISNYLLVNDYGELFAPGGIPYNPASPDFGGAYEVTTENGIVYRVNGASGQLDSATDRNGNTLTFNNSGVVSNNGVGILFNQDSAGRLAEIVDPNGNSVQYQYESGRLVSSVDRKGNTTRYLYESDQPNFLTEVVDALGRTGLRTTYGPDGRLQNQSEDFNGASVSFEQLLEDGSTVIQLADGSVQILRYNEAGQVVELVDELGNTTRREYNERGLSLEIDAEGNETRFVRNTRGDIVERIDADGSSILFSYDSEGRLLSTTNQTGVSTTLEYDENGNLIKIDQGGVVTRQTFDDEGNVVLRELPDGSTDSFSFDSSGFLLSQIIDGREIVFERDANGTETTQSTTVTENGNTETLTLTRQLDRNGNPISIVDSAGIETQQEFDAFNNVVSVTGPNGQAAQLDRDGRPQLQGVTFADGTQGEYSYNERNFLTESISPSGEVIRFVYDDVGNNVARIYSDDTPGTDADNPRDIFEYDGLRRVVAQTNSAGESIEITYNARGQVASQMNSLGETTLFQYDAVGNLVTQTDSAGAVIAFKYDSRGNVIETAFPGGGIELISYDSSNRVIQIDDAVGSVSRFEYDSAGNLNSVTDALGNITRYEYDAFGNLLASIAADGARSEFEFDRRSAPVSTELADGSTVQRTFREDGRVTSEINLAGEETTFTYDDNGRLQEITFFDGSMEQFSYDEPGRATEIADVNGVTTREFNSRGFLTRFVSPNGEDVRYEYDTLDRRTAVVTDDVRTEYVHDLAGRVVSVLENGSAIATNQYDVRGNLTATTFGNGVQEQRAYDDRSRLTSVRIVNTGGDILRTSEFQYDAVGQILSETEGANRFEYEYDRQGQLTSWRRQESGVAVEESTLEYDEVGNLLRRVTDGVESIFRYDAIGQLIEEIENGQATQFDYDDNGNLISASQGGDELYHYTWDARNRLTRVDVFDGGQTTTTTYQYDFSGLLIRRAQSGVETTYAWDRSQRVPVIISATESGETEYFFHSDRILGRTNDSGDQFFYHADASLNVRAQSGSEQSLVFEADYAPFGQILNEEFAVGFEDAFADFEFAGELYDDASGLTYLRQRHLDSELQRFISRDSFAGEIRLPISQQPYQYALNSPLVFSDPTGEFSMPSIAELQVAGTIAATLSTVGVIQVLSNRAFAGGTNNFSGVLGSVEASTPSIGVSLGISYLLGGFGSEDSFTNDDDQFSVALGTGVGATISAGLSASIFPFGASFGSASLDLPITPLTHALRGFSLSGAYVQLDLGYQTITGESPASPIIIGYGYGSASGDSIGTNFGAGVTATFGVYLSVSVAVDGSTAASVREFGEGFDFPTLTDAVSAIRRRL